MTTTETAPDILVEKRTESVLKRSVALVLRCGQLGNHRNVDLTAFQMTKDGTDLTSEKSELNGGIKLFSSKDLRPVVKAIDSVKDRLRAMSVDGGTRLFGPGTYLIPLLGVPEARRVLREGRELTALKAEELVARLPALIAARRTQLGPALFQESEYPTPDDVRAAYRIDWSFVSYATPDQLETVDAVAYQEAVQDQTTRLAEAYDDVVVGLRQGAALVMKELASKLSPNKDGKTKALQPTALHDLQELLQRLPVLNSIGQDDQLAEALARIGVLAEGVDVETLRKAPAIRAMLLVEAVKASETLDQLVLSGGRAMDI